MRSTETSLPCAPMYSSTADPSRRRPMSVALVISAAVFGAADQYLGSRSASPWAVDASQLAAPWLLLPFVIGCTQPSSARRACVLASLSSFAALLGFMAMTLSPVEHANVSLVGVLGLLRWQIRWFVLVSITSPLFGWLGHRWRADRTLWPLLVVAATFCLEAVARTLVLPPLHSPFVRWFEIGVAATLCAVGLVVRLTPRDGH